MTLTHTWIYSHDYIYTYLYVYTYTYIELYIYTYILGLFCYIHSISDSFDTHAYLDILAARNPPVLLPVKLATVREDARACRHVESQGKSFCSEQDAEEPFLQTEKKNVSVASRTRRSPSCKKKKRFLRRTGCGGALPAKKKKFLWRTGRGGALPASVYGSV